MADLDVSWLLGDADFCDSFALVTRAETINDYGESVFEEKTENISGVIQAATADVLNMLPQGAHPTDYIQIWVKRDLQAGSQLIIWRGKVFAVENVQSWANYGDGFCTALCRLESANG